MEISFHSHDRWVSAYRGCNAAAQTTRSSNLRTRDFRSRGEGLPALTFRIRWVSPNRPLRDKMLRELKPQPTQTSRWLSKQWTADPSLIRSFAKAGFASQQRREPDTLAARACVLLRSGSERSDEIAALAHRFRELCAQHDLGDPVIYARWAALVRQPAEGRSMLEDQRRGMPLLQRQRSRINAVDG